MKKAVNLSHKSGKYPVGKCWLISVFYVTWLADCNHLKNTNVFYFIHWCQVCVSSLSMDFLFGPFSLFLFEHEFWGLYFYYWFHSYNSWTTDKLNSFAGFYRKLLFGSYMYIVVILNTKYLITFEKLWLDEEWLCLVFFVDCL